MDDASSLQTSKAQWLSALDEALDNFRSLVAESSSKAWRPVSLAGSSPATPNLASPSTFPSVSTTCSSPTTAASSTPKGSASRSKAREASSLRHVESIEDASSRYDSSTSSPSASAPPKPSPSASSSQPFRLGRFRPDHIAVHRKPSKGPDIYRAVTEVAYEGSADLVAFRSVLQTPETRACWDRLVQSAELVEQLDPITRINKVQYRLGWPASPRDAIVINRTLADDSTLIDIATSLPRSPDAPSYLRPAPPCVRSHVHLMAWCVQLIPPDAPLTSSAKPSATTSSSPLRSSPRIKLTVFWSWDLRGAWMGMPAGGLGMHLPELIKGLLNHVRDSSDKIPLLKNYGNCVELLSNNFDATRDTLVTEYAVVVEDTVARQAEDRAEKDLDTLQLLRSRRKLESALEFCLPATEGWDVRVEVKGQAASVTDSEPSHATQAASSSWHATAERPSGSQYTVLAIRHQQLQDAEQIVRIKVSIQRVVASSDLRLNAEPLNVAYVEPRTPASLAQPLLQDTASISGISVATTSTGSSASVHAAAHIGNAANTSRTGTPNLGFANHINSQIRRNYIYFTSLLQEPEAKWKPISDLKGVTVTQLDSIDPTLVVYRAEATFVGVSVWDLFSTIGNPGARAYWDKTLDDATLLTDINELSSLWHTKTKPSWPVSARDTVVIQTAYKAPSSVHIFSFSTDDRAQFPAIPLTDGSTIRTQIDLRGWSVEALSPTTVHVTMLEQSDPKGWTSKSATPAAMVSAVAGVGEYAIKFGGPPVLTRMLGAKTKVSRYEHEKATFRVEYVCEVPTNEDLTDAPNVECEIRCDIETWASSLDLVVDPPPISISCLRRHKLSQGGGGLWLTIEHAAASLEDDSARITIRRGNSRDKGTVHVNGASIQVDVDQLDDEQVQQLSRQKRSKPQRVPLDLINSARKAADDSGAPGKTSNADGRTPTTASDTAKDLQTISSHSSSANGTDTSQEPAGMSEPAASVGDETVQARENGNPMSTDSSASTVANVPFSDETPRQPMTCALDVLFLLRRIHAERSPDPAGTPAGWALVTERNGLYVRRKLMESISSTVLVQRGDKVVQGLSAEDLLDLVSNPRSRKQWDDKVDSTTLLESYGNGSFTSFITTKASFPFRGRAFHLASLTARGLPPSSLGATNPGSDGVASSSASSWSGPAVYFHASASFPQQNSRFAMDRINPNGLPLGKVLIDGWILETLDPYSSTSFQIPSTRCTHVVAVDYAGSLPVAVNTMWNANLPRSVLLVEEYLKARGSIPSVKTPPPCLQVLGDGRDEDQGLVWSMNEPDRKNLFISTSFDASTRTYVVMSMHRATPQATIASGLLPAANIVNDGQSRPARHSDASLTRGVADKLTQTLNAAPGTPMVASAAPPINSSGEHGLGLSRATSMHSIGSTSATSTASTIRRRPSSIHTDSRNATDLILMEVEIELRHYHKGYDVQVFSEFVPAGAGAKTAVPQTANGRAIDRPATPNGTSTQQSDKEAVLSLSMASEQSKELPVQLRVYDLPPSAVLAATLDPSARPRKHLVRVTVPTTAFLDPVEDPLTGSKPPETPSWYTSLQQRGAVLRMIVQPLKNDGSGADTGAVTAKDLTTAGVPAFATPTGKVTVCSGDAKLEIVHVNQTSAMLQKEQIGVEPMTQLKRVAPARPKSGRRGAGELSAVKEDVRLPAALRRPIGLRKELLDAGSSAGACGANDAKGAKLSHGKGDAVGVAGAGRTSAGSGASGTAESTVDKNSRPDVLSSASNAGSANGSAAGSAPPSRAATPSTAASAGAQIMSMFGSYPLSRLGTGSALASVSSVTARGSSVVSSSSAKTNAEALAANDRAKHANKGAEQKDNSSGSIKQGVEKTDARTTTETSMGQGVGGSAANKGSTVAHAAKERASAIGSLLFDTKFGISTLVLVALVAFLLGSLLRSMVMPVDFVLVRTRDKPFLGATDDASMRKLMDGASAAKSDFMKLVQSVKASTTASSNAAHPAGVVTQVQWTEIRRLLHVPLPGTGWDLVAGGVRRRA